MSRYALDADDEFEPGSNNLVLRNRLGITDTSLIEAAESSALAVAMFDSLNWVSQDTPITAEVICRLHREWLGSIYPMAGKYRTANISKGGLMFCAAPFIENQMKEFESGMLARLTPCSRTDRLELAADLAEVHAEFILIHPFREGNGRASRWVANLMAWQAGFQRPAYALGDEAQKTRYYAALRHGFAGRLGELTKLFEEWLEAS